MKTYPREHPIHHTAQKRLHELEFKFEQICDGIWPEPQTPKKPKPVSGPIVDHKKQKELFTQILAELKKREDSDQEERAIRRDAKKEQYLKDLAEFDKSFEDKKKKLVGDLKKWDKENPSALKKANPFKADFLKFLNVFRG